MKNKLVIPLFSFLFLFIFLSSGVSAYTNFNPNPNLEGSINDYFIDWIGTNGTYSYNATCNAFKGCLFIYSSGNSYYAIFPTNINTTFESYNGINVPYTLNAFTIPSNKEGIIFIRYKFNASLTTPIPYLTVADNGVLTQYPLNTTENIWHNQSVILNASQSSRIITASISFTTDTSTTLFEVDEFRIFTLDDTFFWDSSLDEESMCHYYVNDVTGTSATGFLNNVSGGVYGVMFTNLHNETGINAICFFFDKSLIIRRAIEIADTPAGLPSDWLNGGSSYVYQSYYAISRDIIALMGGRFSGADWYSYTRGFVFGVNSNYITAYGVNCTATAYNCIKGSLGSNDFNTYFNILGSVPYSYIFNNSLDAIVNVPIYNFTISGTKFRFSSSTSEYQSQNYSFFSYVPSTRTYCEFNKMYSVIGFDSILIADCGSCGCADNGLSCFIATNNKYCLDSYNYITNFDNCTSSYGACSYPQTCRNLTSNSIGCYNDTEYQAFITHNQTTSQQLNITARSEDLGEQIGIGEEAGRFLVGMVIIFAVIVGINYYLGTKTKGGQMLPLELNLLLFMILLGFLTFGINLINPFIFVAIVIIGAVLLASKVAKVIPAQPSG